MVKSIKAGAAALLSDIGLFPGRSIVVVNRFPLGGPLVVDLGGYLVAIARSATAGIEVSPKEAPAPSHGARSLQIRGVKRYT